MQRDLLGAELVCGDIGSRIDELIEKRSPSAIHILADKNTEEHCLKKLLSKTNRLGNAHIIVIPPGEESKNPEILNSLYQSLLAKEADRQTLLVNLGGGVVSDIGGFLAASYKRGIDFINIPTSLMGMVDAAIGGKTGINLGAFKNMIGSFNHPLGVYIDLDFLDTLPEIERSSGFAEMLKHGIISDNGDFENLDPEKISTDQVWRSVNIKADIVEIDPTEKAEREKLNLGHTLGHGLEGLAIAEENYISHGHYVANGLILESMIAEEMGLLSNCDLELIRKKISKYFQPVIAFDESKLLEFLKLDKKVKDGKLRMSLPSAIGTVITGQEASEEIILSVITNYRQHAASLAE